MKRLLILLISLTLASPSIANDKALHFIAGGLVSYVAEEDGLLASAIVGALKEGYDELSGGEFDPMDLLATIGGGAVVQLVRYGHLRLSDSTLKPKSSTPKRKALIGMPMWGRKSLPLLTVMSMSAKTALGRESTRTRMTCTNGR